MSSRHPDVSFAGSTVHGLAGREFTNADFTGSNMRHATVADLAGAQLDFSDARLNYTKFRGCRGDVMNFAGADLRYAEFRDCEAGTVDLTGADLRYADLSGLTAVNVITARADTRYATLPNHRPSVTPAAFISSAYAQSTQPTGTDLTAGAAAEYIKYINANSDVQETSCSANVLADRDMAVIAAPRTISTGKRVRLVATPAIGAIGAAAMLLFASPVFGAVMLLANLILLITGYKLQPRSVRASRSADTLLGQIHRRAHAPTTGDDPAHRYAAVIDDETDPVCVYVVRAARAVSDGNIVVTRHSRYELTGDTEHDALVCDQAAGEARALEEGRDADQHETAQQQRLRDEQAADERTSRRITAEVARHSIGQRR